jgi:hypothetical protein
MDGKLDSVQQEFATRLDDFEGKVLTSMKKQIDLSGEALASVNAKLERLMLVVATSVANTTAPSVVQPPMGNIVDSTASGVLDSPAQPDWTEPYNLNITSDHQTTDSAIVIRSPLKKRHNKAGNATSMKRRARRWTL